MVYSIACVGQGNMAQEESSREAQFLDQDVNQCRDEDTEDRLQELRSLSTILESDFSEDIKILSALSNETRYTLIRLLAVADDELCVCELQTLMDVSDSAVSHGLRRLREAGLVKQRKDGRWRFYKTTDDVERLLDTIDSV